MSFCVSQGVILNKLQSVVDLFLNVKFKLICYFFDSGHSASQEDPTATRVSDGNFQCFVLALYLKT